MNESFSTLAMTGMLFSSILSFVLTIGAALWFRTKYGAKWLSLLVGALSFIVFVYFIEGTLHQFALPALMGGSDGSSPGSRAIYVVYACLAAGLVEETARLICLRYVVKEPRLPDALMYGAGHGGIEAILLAGFNSFGLWSLASMVNAYGVTEAASLYSPDSPENAAVAEEQIRKLLALNGMEFFATGLERILAMALHITLSVLIFRALRGGSTARLWLLAAGLHAVSNLPAALYQVGALPNIWLVELLTALLVAGVFVLVRLIYKQSGLPGLPAKSAVDFAPRLKG